MHLRWITVAARRRPRRVAWALFLSALVGAPCVASQDEIDAIVSRLDAGFSQSFDGKTLRAWQLTYQSACQRDVPRLAALLGEPGSNLSHDPYQAHRELLRASVAKMQDAHVQAMDKHVQLSQQWLAAPAGSSQAATLQAQTQAQQQTVALYERIVKTLHDRLAYLEPCAQQAARAFSQAALARQRAEADAKRRAQQQARPAERAPVRPGVDSGSAVAMPTGNTPPVEYDPRNGISIGMIGEREPSDGTPRPPTPTLDATANLGRTPSAADDDQALQQAAQLCKDAYQRAYDDLLKKRRATIDQAKAELPKLEDCIRQKHQDLAYWQQQRRELQVQIDAGERALSGLQSELAAWQAKAIRMEDQAPKNDAARRWGEYQDQADRVERAIREQHDRLAPLRRRLQLIDETIAALQQQQVDCEVRLRLMREKIAAAEKALGDSLRRDIDLHRQKRFAEIERLLANGDLDALQRCATQGYVDLDDLLRVLGP